MIRRLLTLSALLVALGLSACGSSEDQSSAPASPDYEAALAGAPAPLAAVHDQANELLDGGTEAFRRQLADLEGYPVIVNKWASWCGPCRFEFPGFQRLSARFGKQVAFLGVDSDDSPEAAATFLADYPVPYPSFSDPDQEIAKEIGATAGFPMTVFYDRSGQSVYTKFGPYANDADFEADIRRYALDG